MSGQDQDKKPNTNNKKDSKTLKSATVKDEISKGKNMIGTRKPDQININPVLETAVDDAFATEFVPNLNELNIQQRLKKAMNLRKNEPRLQSAKRRSLMRRGTSQTISKRAKIIAIKLIKKRLAGNRDLNSLSAPEKQRIEDLMKTRRGMVKRLANRLIQQARKRDEKRFRKESVDTENLYETVEFINYILDEKLDLANTHLRDDGTDSLVKLYKSMTPNENKKVDEEFYSIFSEEREAVARSGQPRKTIDLVVRSAINRKLSDKPYRQQEVQKKVVDESLDLLDEAISLVDRGEYDYEGAMSRTQLQTICRNARELIDMLQHDENMPEWVQAKITKAEDYITAVTEYLRSREELDQYDDRMEEVDVLEDLRNWFDKNHPEGGWKRLNSKGEVIGDCAREEGEPKPKCMSNEKRAKLTKKERAAAVRAKRKHDPDADREGSPINVSNFGKGKISEEILEEENVPTNPALWSKAKTLAKQKFDVYPCVPMESKAISKDGLKSYGELSVGEEILSYNIEKNVLEWKPIIHLHFYENAPLKRIYKKTGFCVRATENHKWVVKTGNEYEKVSLVETKDIHKRMRLLTCAALETETATVLENWSKKDNWVSKVISWPKTMREVYLASSIVYDGHDVGGSTKIKDRHTFGFSQKNDDHFWAAILAAYLNGYHVSFHEKTETISGASIIRNKPYHSTQNLIIEDDVSEDVWCPTTENQTWVMVQNGFITITGNSAYANGWAAKWYKSKGGGWKTLKEEEEGCPIDEELEISELIEEDFMPTGEELYEDWNELEEEAIKNGRKVKLNKPFLTPDGPKKRAVYVKNDNGNVVKVNFGDPNMRIKKNIPARRKSFRARHNCDNPGPKHKARYWSCKAW